MRNTYLAVFLFLAFLNVPLTSSAEEIIVMFPKFQEIQDPDNGKVIYEKMGSWNNGEYIEKELKAFVSSFRPKGYKVESIELWIEGIAKTEQITKIFVTWEGESSCKIVLKPSGK